MPPDAPPTIANLFQGVLTRRVLTDANGKATLFPLRTGNWRVTLIDPARQNQPVDQQTTGDVNLTGQSGAITLKLKS
jgi:hypothetical protein